MNIKKLMGIIMIIFGTAIAIIGIIMVASKSKEQQLSNEAPSSSSLKAAADQPKIDDEIGGTIVNAIPGSNTQEISPSKAKGNGFEDFVVNLLADWRFTLLDRTQDAMSSAGVVAESSKNPDLEVRQKRNDGNVEYFIECKYRSKWGKDNKIQFEKWQVDRYHEFQREKKRKVLIALGVGGTPTKPETFMLVPLDSLKYGAIRKIDNQFVVQPNPDALHEYVNHYFTIVFDKAKEKK